MSRRDHMMGYVPVLFATGVLTPEVVPPRQTKVYERWVQEEWQERRAELDRRETAALGQKEAALPAYWIRRLKNLCDSQEQRFVDLYGDGSAVWHYRDGSTSKSHFKWTEQEFLDLGWERE